MGTLFDALDRVGHRRLAFKNDGDLQSLVRRGMDFQRGFGILFQ